MSKNGQNNKGGCRELGYNDIVFFAAWCIYCLVVDPKRIQVSSSLRAIARAYHKWVWPSIERLSLRPDMEQTNEIDQGPEKSVGEINHAILIKSTGCFVSPPEALKSWELTVKKRSVNNLSNTEYQPNENLKQLGLCKLTIEFFINSVETVRESRLLKLHIVNSLFRSPIYGVLEQLGKWRARNYLI